MRTSEYEARQAQDTKNIRDTEAARTQQTQYANTNEKESNEMKDTFTVKTITAKVINMIASWTVDYNYTPINAGFKDNKLNETEFRLFATKLYNYKQTHDKVTYDSLDARAQIFYRLRDTWSTLTCVTVPPKAPEKQYNVPTDTDLLKTIETLRSEKKALRDNANAFYKWAMYCTDEYLKAGQLTKKGERVIVRHDTVILKNDQYHIGHALAVTEVPLTVLTAYVNLIADYGC